MLLRKKQLGKISHDLITCLFSQQPDGCFFVVIRKAQEYERLLHLKTAASGFHIQVTTQMVVCLDLAASAENQIVDKVTHTIGFL